MEKCLITILSKATEFVKFNGVLPKELLSAFKKYTGYTYQETGLEEFNVLIHSMFIANKLKYSLEYKIQYE